MRYPGEWKFAGGVVDADETPLQAAMRELEEEFQVPTALTEAGGFFFFSGRFLVDSMGFQGIWDFGGCFGVLAMTFLERTSWNSTLLAAWGCHGMRLAHTCLANNPPWGNILIGTEKSFLTRRWYIWSADFDHIFGYVRGGPSIHQKFSRPASTTIDPLHMFEVIPTYFAQCPLESSLQYWLVARFAIVAT